MWCLNSSRVLFCLSGRSVARNVTVDSERPAASSIVSPATTVANGSVSSASQSHRPVPLNRPKDRPRSIGSQLETLKPTAVNRTSSIRLEDISSPRLQSSTNHSVTQIPSSVPASRADDAERIGTKLLPTRTAPAPPAEQPHKPPQRPPPPCPKSAALNQYEEIALESPTGPPPAPPDSRHRFYSSQLPRQPATASVPEQADGTLAISVSSMRSKFEPVGRSSSPSTQQHSRRADIKNCSVVPAGKSQCPPTVPRPAPLQQHSSVRTSPGVNESQC